MKGLKLFCFSLVLCVSIAHAESDDRRTPSGKPDLSGFYDTGTLTPLQRPEFLGPRMAKRRFPKRTHYFSLELNVRPIYFF